MEEEAAANIELDEYNKWIWENKEVHYKWILSAGDDFYEWIVAHRLEEEYNEFMAQHKQAR